MKGIDIYLIFSFFSGVAKMKQIMYYMKAFEISWTKLIRKYLLLLINIFS